MKLTDEEVARVIAGIRGGMEVVFGGSRCHSTYRVNSAGGLVIEDFDEGHREERPCSEADLSVAIVASPESFLDVLRSPLRAALRDALLGIRTERSPQACLADLLVYGDCLNHRDLLEAVLAWPATQPAAEVVARLATMTGLEVYHAIMSALGYGTRSTAVGDFGVRFYEAVEEMLGAHEMPERRRYRADFRDMAGDSAGALEDLAWELARLPDGDTSAEILQRQIATIADRPLLAAIAAAPDDDAPRLVWADALSERGDPRGELIVAQCSLARLDEDDAARAGLEPRVEQLVALHGWEWARRHEPTFERGFVASVDVRWLAFAEEADALFAISPPLRELRFRSARNDPTADAGLVFADPRLERIPALDLGLRSFFDDPRNPGELRSAHGACAGVVEALEGRLPGLRELTLRDAGLEAAEIVRIGARTELRRLDLGDCLRLKGAGAMLAAGGLRKLRFLSFARCGIDDDDAGGIARLAHLEELDLSECPVGPATAVAIALLPVQRLSLAGTALGDDGAAILSRAPSLVSLNLSSNRIGKGGVAALAELPLTSLALQNTLLDEALVGLLVRGRIASSLRRLSIGNWNVPRIGPDVARLLSGMPLLWDLDLRDCAIDGDGAAALLEGLPGLRSLRLGQCAVDEAGLAKLVAHPRFDQLETLELDQNGLGPGAGEVLARARRLPLRLLLRGNALGDAGARALAAAPAAAGIVALDLQENGITEEGARVLHEARRTCQPEALT